MLIRRLTVGPFQSNCYVVGPSSDDGIVVIDPGADGESILAALEETDGNLTAILLTHAHLDHIGAVAELKAVHDVPVYLHPADLPLYERAEAQAAAFGLTVDPPPLPDEELRHGERLSLGEIVFDVRHAPGHSPGGVVFVDDRVAFVGDCVFAGSIGRTDLPGGDMHTLLESIHSQVLTLAPEIVLCPGHGPETTVERETAANPFLNGSLQWDG